MVRKNEVGITSVAGSNFSGSIRVPVWQGHVGESIHIELTIWWPKGSKLQHMAIGIAESPLGHRDSTARVAGINMANGKEQRPQGAQPPAFSGILAGRRKQTAVVLSDRPGTNRESLLSSKSAKPGKACGSFRHG